MYVLLSRDVNDNNEKQSMREHHDLTRFTIESLLLYPPRTSEANEKAVKMRKERCHAAMK